jgi:transposase
MPRKLNFQEIEEVKKLLKTKSTVAIAKELDVSIRIISEIKNDLYVPKVPPKDRAAIARPPGKKQERKLTPNQVREIRKLLTQKKTIKSIAAQFNVNVSAIHGIRDGQTYKDVK